MTEPRGQLRDNSDELLGALDDLKSLEREKRTQEISSPPFHEMAEAIEDKSREVFRMAATERQIGDTFEESQGMSTEEVPGEPAHER
jgi:hypothetical protein